MGVGLCERDHGTHAIGHQLDVPAPRAPLQAGTATKVPQPTTVGLGAGAVCDSDGHVFESGRYRNACAPRIRHSS